MSKYSDNFKKLMKYTNEYENTNCDVCQKQGNQSKQTYANNYRKSKNMLQANTITNSSQNNNNGGVIRYGNFGKLLNGTINNNDIISSLLTDLKQIPNTSDNYVYVTNVINTYLDFNCVSIDSTNKQYDYNQFYKNYNELQLLLSDIYQNNVYCGGLIKY